MAKQSGIHQLRGKVGEHSYYRQTGVPGGLVRSINPAMSSRVKTDEAYANTRLNNAEFGQAGRIAAVLARFISPKYRPMVLPFSQSKMAKIILENIKESGEPWGNRNLIEGSAAEPCCIALNSVVKNNFDDYGIVEEVDTKNNTITLPYSQQLNDKLSAIGANGIDARVIACSPWIGRYMVNEKRYSESYTRGNIYDDELATSGSPTDFAFTFRDVPPQGWPAFQPQFLVVILMPFRLVSGEKYILQEHCTYKAIAFEG